MGSDINPYVERPDGSIRRKKSPKEMKDEEDERRRLEALDAKAEQLEKSMRLSRDYLS